MRVMYDTNMNTKGISLILIMRITDTLNGCLFSQSPICYTFLTCLQCAEERLFYMYTADTDIYTTQ